MLLIVGCSGDTGNDAKNGAEPVVDAVNCIGYPAAAAAMPAFPLQNRVESTLRVRRTGHDIQCPRMRSFFERTGSQKLLHVSFFGERTFPLGAEFLFMLF